MVNNPLSDFILEPNKAWLLVAEQMAMSFIRGCSLKILRQTFVPVFLKFSKSTLSDFECMVWLESFVQVIFMGIKCMVL